MRWPKEYSKRGQQTREQAFKQFDVKAVTKTVLLPGQSRLAYHGGKLEEEYYFFTFKERKTGREGAFYCGDTAAQGWFALNGQLATKIMSYNPLTGQYYGGQGSSNGSSGSSVQPKQTDNPEMKKLIHVIQTFIILTDNVSQDSAAVFLLQKLIACRGKAPELGQVRAVNTLFCKTFDGGNSKISRGATSYSSYVACHNMPIKVIDVTDFNKTITDNINKSAPIFIYPWPASF